MSNPCPASVTAFVLTQRAKGVLSLWLELSCRAEIYFEPGTRANPVDQMGLYLDCTALPLIAEIWKKCFMGRITAESVCPILCKHNSLSQIPSVLSLGSLSQWLQISHINHTTGSDTFTALFIFTARCVGQFLLHLPDKVLSFVSTSKESFFFSPDNLYPYNKDIYTFCHITVIDRKS